MIDTQLDDCVTTQQPDATHFLTSGTLRLVMDHANATSSAPKKDFVFIISSSQKQNSLRIRDENAIFTLCFGDNFCH